MFHRSVLRRINSDGVAEDEEEEEEEAVG